MSEKVMGEFAINNEQVNNNEGINNNGLEFKPAENLPTKVGFWTPKQQKVEDEINEFLHQEITWQGVKDFLFQEITFGKKNK